MGEGNIFECKTLLKSFMRSVGVSEAEVIVNYTLPMPPVDAEKETIGVIDFRQSGRPCRTKGRIFSKTFALVY